jgi:membrane protease YdiL (CAAX protease family)
MIVVQVIAVAGFMAVQSFWAHDIKPDAFDGLLLSLGTWASMPVCLAMIVLFVKARNQLSVRDYLSLHGVSLRQSLPWVGLLVILLAAEDLVSILLERRPSAFMVDAYHTAVIVPLFWATIVIAAPVFEEILFRGFLFHGIQQSRLGNAGAILITSLIWAGFHQQYDLFEMGVIFLVGILFGLARAKTGSIYLTMGLHALMNLIAMIELWLCL